MNILRAKELLAALADGVNPLTGEILAEDGICKQVEIVRALNTVVRLPDQLLSPFTLEISFCFSITPFHPSLKSFFCGE